MGRISFDENLHFLFYRDITTAALAVDPSGIVCAMAEVVTKFKMPGKGIPDFERHSRAVAAAGIYDLAIHHDQILVPIVLRHWGLTELGPLTDEAERARDKIVKHVARLGRIAARLAERRGPTAVAV